MMEEGEGMMEGVMREDEGRIEIGWREEGA